MELELTRSDPEVIRVEAKPGWVSLELGQLWEYRELIYFFAWRDIKVRYKQTILGAGWTIIQPLTSMVIFSIFFGRLIGVPSDGIPYPIFNYAALVPWMYFTTVLTYSANGLLSSASMIKKIYFPRLVIAIASLISGGVDFLIAFVVLIAMIFYYNRTPTVNILWLPALLVLAIVASLGVGLWLATLNARYRDVKYLLPFLIQVWFFVTPITYPSSILSGTWKILYGLNPMAGVVEGFRWALLGTETPPGPMLAVSAVASVVLLVSGAFYHRKTERTIADVI